MAKKNLSIVNAWNWFVTITDTNILSSSEQLILIHLIKFINRNFWKPVKIEPKILAKSTNKDNRTVKKALTTLINKGFITNSERGYFIGINNTTELTNTNEPTDKLEYFDFPASNNSATS